METHHPQEGMCSLTDPLPRAVPPLQPTQWPLQGGDLLPCFLAGMDELMEVSFSPLAATGKPLSRCGKCHRFMKYIQVGGG